MCRKWRVATHQDYVLVIHLIIVVALVSQYMIYIPLNLPLWFSQ